MNGLRRAIVLAAGRGKRMGALTEDTPKPMLRVDGKPLLEHVIERLRSAGIDEIAIVVGYRRELIEDYFRSYRLPITFLTQQHPNGTAAAALLAASFAGEEPFLLTFGDILCGSAEYRGMSEMLLSEPDLAAVVGVRKVDDPWRGAAVYEDRGYVTSIVEKPAPGTSTTNWNSAGLYAFRPEVFDELRRVPLSTRGEYELTSAVEQLLWLRRKLRLFEMRSAWRDVGTPEDLAQAAETVRDSE